LDVVKKTNERRPRALHFEGSENCLVLGGGVARADRGILNHDVMFAGDLFDLVEKRRGFAGAFQSGLMLREPLGPLLPKGALANEDLLHFARVASRGKIGAGMVEGAQEFAPDDPIQE